MYKLGIGSSPESGDVTSFWFILIIMLSCCLSQFNLRGEREREKLGEERGRERESDRFQVLVRDDFGIGLTMFGVCVCVFCGASQLEKERGTMYVISMRMMLLVCVTSSLSSSDGKAQMKCKSDLMERRLFVYILFAR